MTMQKTQNETRIKRLVIDIPEDLHHKIKVQAASEKRTVKSIVLGLVTGYLQTSNKTYPG